MPVQRHDRSSDTRCTTGSWLAGLARVATQAPCAAGAALCCVFGQHAYAVIGAVSDMHGRRTPVKRLQCRATNRLQPCAGSKQSPTPMLKAPAQQSHRLHADGEHLTAPWQQDTRTQRPYHFRRDFSHYFRRESSQRGLFGCTTSQRVSGRAWVRCFGGMIASRARGRVSGGALAVRRRAPGGKQCAPPPRARGGAGVGGGAEVVEGRARIIKVEA